MARTQHRRPVPGALLRLIRDGEAVTRADLARRTGLARSTVAQRVEALLAHELVYEAGGSASTGGRPPTVLAFNRARRRRAGRRPRRDALAPGRLRSRRDAARRARVRHRHRARARRSCSAGCTSASASCWPMVGRGADGRARDRRRRPGAGRVLARRAGRAADHAGLGRLLDPGLVRAPLRRAGARRQRREHHGAGRALDALARLRAPAVREDRHRHRLRHRRRRGASTAARRARRATSATCGWPGTTDVVCRCGNVGCLEAVAGGRALAGELPRPGCEATDLARRRAPRARGRAAGDRRGARRRPLPRRGARRVRSTSSTRARS